MSAVDPEESCLRTLIAWRPVFFCDFSSSCLLFPEATVVGVVFTRVAAVGVDVGVLGVDVGVVGVDVGAVGVDVGAVGVDVGAVGVDVGAVGVDVGVVAEGTCSREMPVGLNVVEAFSKLLDLGILAPPGFTI